MTLRQFTHRMRVKQRMWSAERVRIMEDVGRFGLQQAWRYSSGMYSLAMLALLGHPYGHGAFGSMGRRGSIPYGDAAMVNKQTGDFYAHWEIAGPFVTKYYAVVSIQNHSWVAEFLKYGTSKMIARPIEERIFSLTSWYMYSRVAIGLGKVFVL